MGPTARGGKDGEHQAPAALGHDLFDYYATEPEEAAAFTGGLKGMTAVAEAEAARVIDTADVRLAVDVGGASGDLLHDLMLVNPQLEGVVFDLPNGGAVRRAVPRGRAAPDGG